MKILLPQSLCQINSSSVEYRAHKFQLLCPPEQMANTCKWSRDFKNVFFKLRSSLMMIIACALEESFG